MQLGDVLSSWEVVNFARGIHYNSMDFVEGNISENIEKYDQYEVREVLVSELEQPAYYIDDELLEKYRAMRIEEMPPLILGFYEGNKFHQTIDGGHRTILAREANLRIVKALVAIPEI